MIFLHPRQARRTCRGNCPALRLPGRPGEWWSLQPDRAPEAASRLSQTLLLRTFPPATRCRTDASRSGWRGSLDRRDGPEAASWLRVIPEPPPSLRATRRQVHAVAPGPPPSPDTSLHDSAGLAP